MTELDADRPPPEQGVFANRTLNLRAVPAIGYDMDYTLIHYRVDEWEGAAFRGAEATSSPTAAGPSADLDLRPRATFTIGLVFDLQLGNLVKATRFGYVVRAQHGNEAHDSSTSSARTSTRDRRRAVRAPLRFMNTLFELSTGEPCSPSSSTDPRRASPFPASPATPTCTGGSTRPSARDAHGWREPSRPTSSPTPTASWTSIPDIVPTLLDQRAAGKQLLLITNSDWAYTRRMMTYAVDPLLPGRHDLAGPVRHRDRVGQQAEASSSKTDPIYRVVDEEASRSSCPTHGPLESGPRLLRRQRPTRGGKRLGDHGTASRSMSATTCSATST